MNPQSLIKKTLWFSLLSWAISDRAEAMGVQGSAPVADGGFILPPLGEFMVFGLVALAGWGLSVWLMDRNYPQSKSGNQANVDPVHYEVQNFELSGIQSKTDRTLSWMQEEYEQMVLDRLHEPTEELKSQAGTEEYRGQRAASV